MRIAILAFDGFNELDSLIALGILNQPFTAQGNVATAGGCLAAPYLAAWVIARLAGIEAAEEAMYYFAPVGEKEAFVARALGHIAQQVTVYTSA